MSKSRARGRAVWEARSRFVRTNGQYRGYTEEIRRKNKKTQCAWCRRPARAVFVGVFTDPVPTCEDAICTDHLARLEKHRCVP